MLCLSSIPNEYYLGDLPGTLQYKKEPEDLKNMHLIENDNTLGFVLCEHSLENLKRVIPKTQSKKEWKIILMMKKEQDGETWLKTALLNKETGKIALLTSTNCKENLTRRGNRAVETLDMNWFVGHYRMAAPIMFWRELQNRLIYS